MGDGEQERRARAAYDTVAVSYADLLRDELDSNPFDRAALGAFSDLVLAAGGGPVLEVGCGSGRVARWLRGRGLDVRGVDLSPQMVRVAREEHPGLDFEVGSLSALDVEDGSLAAVVAWYSIIHTAPADLPAAFAELARVVAVGGQVLLAFQVGDEARHVTRAYGHDVDLTAWTLQPETVRRQLAAAGVTVRATTLRDPAFGHERHPQAYLFGRRER